MRYLRLGLSQPHKSLPIIIGASCLVLLSACWANPSILNPSPSPTIVAPTQTQPLPTPTSFSATPSPSATPTPQAPTTIVPSTPQYPASNYQLRQWDDAFADALANNILQQSNLQNSFPGSPHEVARILSMERLLRIPQLSQQVEVAWDLAGFDPAHTYRPELRPDQELFGWLVEYALNEQNISIEGLPAFLEPYRFYLGEPTQIDNLFGDGQPAWIFVAKVYTFDLFGEVMSAVAIHRENGLYRLHKITDWEIYDTLASSSDIAPLNLGDVNGNGLVELVLESSYWMGGGYIVNASQSLVFLEWQPEAEQFARYEVTIFYQQCNYGPCTGTWQFGSPNQLGSRPLITHYYLFTNGFFSIYSSQSEGSCPNLDVETIYEWNGQKYEIEQSTLLRSQSDRPECHVAWAVTVIRSNYHGWEHDEAISILTNALENWPANMEESWGPAGYDYLKLQTALWLDLRGDHAQALNLLQSLSTRPLLAQYPLASHLAAAYLEERNLTGQGGACWRIQQMWRNEVNTILTDPYSQADLDKLLQNFGFVDDRWEDGVDDLCDVAYLLETSALPINSTSTIEQWLQRTGTPVLSFHPVDLNEDGLEDWLVLQDGPFYYELWAYLQTSEGLWVRHVTNFAKDFDNEEPSLVLSTFRSQSTAPLIHIALLDDYLRAFWVTPDLKIEKPVSEFGVTDFEIGTDLVIHATDYSGIPETAVYYWDEASTQLVEKMNEQLAREDFDLALQKAQQLLFQDQDPESAISLIENTLTEMQPAVPCPPDTCTDQFVEYRAHLRYILGLAYELTDQPDMAFNTYYQLWQNEPDTIFGMAASLKLEPLP